MAQRAFVFSSDLKTLGILTLIFEELAVSYEHCSDSVTAIKKISSEGYDAVLVDCDALQSATQIFAILRGSTINHGAMSVAMVDGKAGVPTAFRLGAKTVLSKPLSMEQARTTLRNALAMQRRDTQENKAHAAAATVSQPPAAPTSSAPELESPLSTNSFRTFATPKAPEAVQPAAASEPVIAASAQGAAAAPARALSKPANEQSPVEAPKAAPIAEHKAAPAAPKPVEKSVASKTLAPQVENKPPVPRTQTSAATPSFAMLGDTQKKSNRGMIIGLLVAAVAIAAVAFQPRVRSAISWQYARLVHHNVAATPVAPVTTEPAPAPQTAPTDATANAPQPDPAPVAPDPSTLAQGFQDTPPDASALSTAPAADNAQPVAVPGDLAAAHIVHSVAPWYPTKARHAHIKGAVVLNANVAADGTVQSTDVVSGNPMLTLAAQEAVKQWQYQPYYQDGQPVAFQTQVRVNFPQPKR